MTLLLDIIQQIKQVTHDQQHQFDILNALADRFKIVIPKAVDDKTAKAVQTAVLKFEANNGTGYDCGWVTAIFFNGDKVVSGYKAVADQKDDRLTVKTYSTCGLEFTLADYPIYVQSVTMQAFVMKQVLDLVVETVPVRYYLETRYD